MFRAVDAMLGTAAVLLVAQAVPTINVEPHCRTVARNAAPVGDVESCLRVEEEARVQLVAQWDQFAPADKDHCLRLSRLGVEPTYTELLTCLELARDARILRQQKRS
jgi:hypothetical protein